LVFLCDLFGFLVYASTTCLVDYSVVILVYKVILFELIVGC